MRTTPSIAIVVLVLCAAACGDSSTTAGTEPETIEDPPAGAASVTIGTERRTDFDVEARFTVTQEEGDLDSLLLVVSASNGDDEFVNVTIEKQKQIERGPLSLIGTHEIRLSHNPLYSGIVSARWRGEDMASSDEEGTSFGELTITEHADGKIGGELSATLANGEAVRVEFEGPARGTCLVPTEDTSESDRESVGFDDPFCAQYFR